MSVNDFGVAPTKGTDIIDGLRNPTTKNTNASQKDDNFVSDPGTEELGAGAPSDFSGHENAKRQMRLGKDEHDVIESQPGIIEGANIDPLGPNSNRDDGYYNATVDPSKPNWGVGATLQTKGTSAVNAATGAAQMAYGSATGDKETYNKGAEKYENS